MGMLQSTAGRQGFAEVSAARPWEDHLQPGRDQDWEQHGPRAQDLFPAHCDLCLAEQYLAPVPQLSREETLRVMREEERRRWTPEERAACDAAETTEKHRTNFLEQYDALQRRLCAEWYACATCRARGTTLCCGRAIAALHDLRSAAMRFPDDEEIRQAVVWIRENDSGNCPVPNGAPMLPREGEDALRLYSVHEERNMDFREICLAAARQQGVPIVGDWPAATVVVAASHT